MKTMDKEFLLASLEAQTETHLQEVIAGFQNLPEDVLLKPSLTGGWSMAQCLEHLNSYGRYYLPAIKKALDKAPAASNNSFTSGWLGAYFIRIMDPKTSKKNYTAFKDHVPASDLKADEVVAEFIHQQELLLAYLRQARRTDLNALRIPISIARFITLKLGDILQFIVAHNERHLQQAARNLSH